MGMIDKPVLIGVLILAVALVVAFSFSNNAVGRKVPAISIGGGGGSTFDECGSDYDCSSGWNCINGICVQNAVTYQGVLEMLENNCMIYTYENETANNEGLTTGIRVCNSHNNMKCIMTETYPSQGQSFLPKLSNCNTWNDYSVLRTVCCWVS